MQRGKKRYDKSGVKKLYTMCKLEDLGDVAQSLTMPLEQELGQGRVKLPPKSSNANKGYPRASESIPMAKAREAFYKHKDEEHKRRWGRCD